MRIEDTAHDIARIKMLPVLIEQQIFYIDHADDIVCRVFVYRITGVFVFPVQFYHIIVACVDIQEAHVYFWHHDILGSSVSKVEYIVNHFTLFWLNDTIFVADFHDGTDLFFRIGFGTVIGVDPHQKQDSHGEIVHDEDQWCGDRHPDIDDARVPESNPFRMDGGTGLGGNLTKDQDNQRQDTGGNTGSHGSESGACQELCDQDGRQRGGRDIDDVVTDQDRA